MKHSKIVTFLLLCLCFVSCDQQEKDPQFSDLSEKERSSLQQEVIDSMKQEVHERMAFENDFYKTYYPPPPCGMIHHFSIQRNRSGLIMIKSKIDSIENIPSAVFEYFTANAELSQSDVNTLIGDPRYQFFNYPFYSSLTRSDIVNGIAEHDRICKN